MKFKKCQLYISYRVGFLYEIYPDGTIRELEIKNPDRKRSHLLCEDVISLTYGYTIISNVLAVRDLTGSKDLKVQESFTRTFKVHKTLPKKVKSNYYT